MVVEKKYKREFDKKVEEVSTAIDDSIILLKKGFRDYKLKYVETFAYGTIEDTDENAIVSSKMYIHKAIDKMDSLSSEIRYGSGPYDFINISEYNVGIVDELYNLEDSLISGHDETSTSSDLFEWNIKILINAKNGFKNEVNEVISKPESKVKAIVTYYDEDYINEPHNNDLVDNTFDEEYDSIEEAKKAARESGVSYRIIGESGRIIEDTL